MIQNEERIFGLDLMQAAAIIMVLFAQCLWILPQNNAVVTQLTGLFYFLGIEVFLVLSGFLLGKMLLPLYINHDFGRGSLMIVLKKLAAQILPVYFLVLLLNFLIAILNNNSIESGWKYLLMLQNFTSPMTSFFPESWIVPVIFFAAIVLFVALFVLNRFIRANNKLNVFFYTTLLLTVVFLLTKYLYNTNTTATTIDQWNTEIKSVVIYRMDSVFIGLLFCWLQFHFHSIWIKYKMLFALFGFMGLAFIFVGVGHFHLLIQDHKLFWNVFYLPITSLSIAFLFPLFSEWIFAPSVIRRPINFIAMISYPVYIVHIGVVLQLMKYLYPAALLNVHNLFWFVFLYIAFTIILGSVLFQYYQILFIRKIEKLN